MFCIRVLYLKPPSPDAHGLRRHSFSSSVKSPPQITCHAETGASKNIKSRDIITLKTQILQLQTSIQSQHHRSNYVRLEGGGEDKNTHINKSNTDHHVNVAFEFIRKSTQSPILTGYAAVPWIFRAAAAALTNWFRSIRNALPLQESPVQTPNTHRVNTQHTQVRHLTHRGRLRYKVYYRNAAGGKRNMCEKEI